MTTAFVLGGGGVLGAVEVGMLRALLERDVTPDLVLGTSIGAFNGALVASSLAKNTSFAEIPQLPSGGLVRLVPREVAETSAAGAFNSSTETLTDLRIVRTESGLKWTALRTPQGLFRTFSKKSQGLIELDAERTARLREDGVHETEVHRAQGLMLHGLGTRVRARRDVDRQRVLVDRRVEARLDQVFDERIDLVDGAGGETGIGRIGPGHHAAHQVAALRGLPRLPLGDRTDPMGAGCRAVERARATPCGAVLDVGDDVAAVDESLEVFAHRVGMQLRRRAEVGDRALAPHVQGLQDLHARVAGDRAVRCSGHTSKYGQLARGWRAEIFRRGGSRRCLVASGATARRKRSLPPRRG
jgi:hypothetical protein